MNIRVNTVLSYTDDIGMIYIPDENKIVGYVIAENRELNDGEVIMDSLIAEVLIRKTM